MAMFPTKEDYNHKYKQGPESVPAPVDKEELEVKGIHMALEEDKWEDNKELFLNSLSISTQ
jgi:hypothetical protein